MLLKANLKSSFQPINVPSVPLKEQTINLALNCLFIKVIAPNWVKDSLSNLVIFLYK